MTGIEKLRRLSRMWAYDCKVLVEQKKLESIADQIECEMPAQEDREAIAWVREQGGLDAVKRRWECLSYYADPVPRSYAERRIAARQRQIDESHAALRRRNARIVELEQECDELREMVRSLNALTDEMEKRLMPEGMADMSVRDLINLLEEVDSDD